jgi:hypothetical protein
VKYPNLKDITLMVAIPDKPSLVALIDMDKGSMVDVRNKKFVKSIPQWGGKCILFQHVLIVILNVIFLFLFLYNRQIIFNELYEL